MVLFCIAAGIIEFVVLRAHTTAAFTVVDVAVLTSVVCTVAGFVGLIQKPRTVSTAICGLGLVVGILGIVLSVFALLIGIAFTSVSF